jgi:hypothetical protein
VKKVPETRYAALGDDVIAYQVFGKGDVDLLYVPATKLSKIPGGRNRSASGLPTPNAEILTSIAGS